MSIAVIDFEIANSNYNSACSIGIAVIEGLEIVNEEYFLIRPPGLVVDPEMSKVNRLTKRDLIGAFPFEVIWSKIKHYFNGDYIIAAHNAYFDLNVLKNCLLLADEDNNPDFVYFDTIQYTTPVCKGIGSSLAKRLDYFGITLENAHNALADARATAELIIRATELAGIKSVEQYLIRQNVSTKEFNEIKMTTEFLKRSNTKGLSNKKVTDIVAEVKYFDKGHPLFDAQVVFTGDLKSMDRKSAAQAVTDLGGIIKNGVSRKTNFLVVGPQDPKLVGTKGVSTKEIKAAELIDKGFRIAIIDEDVFIELINFEVPEEQMSLIESKGVIEDRKPKKKDEDVVIFSIGLNYEK